MSTTHRRDPAARPGCRPARGHGHARLDFTNDDSPVPARRARARRGGEPSDERAALGFDLRSASSAEAAVAHTPTEAMLAHAPMSGRSDVAARQALRTDPHSAEQRHHPAGRHRRPHAALRAPARAKQASGMSVRAVVIAGREVRHGLLGSRPAPRRRRS